MTVRIRRNRDGSLTVSGQGYRIRITEGEWIGDQQRYTARLEADGFDPQWSYFAPAPGRDFDIDLAECALALFTLGRGDVDDEFFEPDPAHSWDERWIGPNIVRESWLAFDHEAIERRQIRFWRDRVAARNATSLPASLPRAYP